MEFLGNYRWRFDALTLLGIELVSTAPGSRYPCRYLYAVLYSPTIILSLNPIPPKNEIDLRFLIRYTYGI